MTGRFLAATATLTLLLAGAAAVPADPGAGDPEAPTLRLERVIDLDRPAGKGRKLVRWLTGRKESPVFRRPYAVAWDGEDLLVADPDAGRVARIDRRGRVHLSPPGAVANPIGLAVCEGSIVATDSRVGKIAVLDADLGRRRWLLEGLSRPTGAVCVGNRLFIAETGEHRILVIENGEIQTAIGRRGSATGEFNFPTSLTLSPGERSLWVGDTLNFRLQRVDTGTGRALATFGSLGDGGGDMPRIKGIATDPVGRLWVADALLDQVAIYDSSGVYLASVGARGSAPGEFSFPAGIATQPDGRVAVVDSLNRRIQIFRLAGGTAGR